MAELRRLSRSGHALVIHLPKAFLSELRLEHGSTVFVELVDRSIVITQAVTPRQAKLLERGALKVKHAP